MSMFDAVIDNYEYGWNLTRARLLGFTTFSRIDIFGNWHIAYDYGPRRDMEAEKLHEKYKEMASRKEKVNYCRGALDFIQEWDTMGRCPDELEVIDFDEDYDEDEV